MSDTKLVADTIAELQDKIATQREVICNLTAMNDELQAKIDNAIKEIENERDSFSVLGYSSDDVKHGMTKAIEILNRNIGE